MFQGVSGPIIRPWMVPSPLWGKNLRAVLTQDQWDVVRKDSYAKAGNRCRVCGGFGPKWPVEADEAWDYDDDNCVHTLKGVIALCPACHEIRHWGLTQLKGREAEAIRHLKWVNSWTNEQAEDAINEAFDLWNARSEKVWTTDYSWVERNYGFVISPEGLERAEQVHLTFTDPSGSPDAQLAHSSADPIQPSPRSWLQRTWAWLAHGLGQRSRKFPVE